VVNLQKEISILKASLSEKLEFDFRIVEKLTRFYTGMPTYDSFVALVDYLEPKS